MTIDEAVFAMEHYKLHFALTPKAVKAFDMAIKALEQQPCDDVVSRRAVYEIINDAYFLKLDDGAALQESIHQLPSVTPQPKMCSSSETPNEWIPVETALPEWGVSVLVYAERNAYDDKGQSKRKVIDIGWQCGGDWHIDGCNGVVGIAWIPLPTPPNMSEIPTGSERSEEEAYSFPEVFGEPIEMLIDGIWVKGKVINDYRSRDGIVNMETADGKKYWCGCERTDCYRQPKEGDAE